MIDADGPGGDTAAAHAERIENVLPHRLARLGAEPLDAFRRVVAIERRQVDAGHGLQKPRGLRVLFHRPAARQRRHAPFGSRQIDALIDHPAEIEFRAIIARPVVTRGRRCHGFHGHSLHSKVFQAIAPRTP
ncbi:hypothetical protein D3C87_1641450 [compost metagenome]